MSGYGIDDLPADAVVLAPDPSGFVSLTAFDRAGLALFLQHLLISRPKWQTVLTRNILRQSLRHQAVGPFKALSLSGALLSPLQAEAGSPSEIFLAKIMYSRLLNGWGQGWDHLAGVLAIYSKVTV